MAGFGTQIAVSAVPYRSHTQQNKIIHYKYLCVLRGEIQGDYNSTEKKIGSARQKKYIKITSFSKSGIDKFSTMNETEIL